MTHVTDYKAAGAMLADALKNDRAGFIARVAIAKDQAEFAAGLANYRRGLAKLSKQRCAVRNYAEANAVLTAADKAQLATEKRAMLAEMLVADMLTIACVPFKNQSYVEHVPAPEPDLMLFEREYDIKASGQVSYAWSHGPARDRFSDDAGVTINRGSHDNYCARPAFAGYVCVYIYVLDETPYAADVFYVPADEVGKLRTASIDGWKDMSYYKPALPFPDGLRAKDWSARAQAARNAEPCPFPPARKGVH